MVPGWHASERWKGESGRARARLVLTLIRDDSLTMRLAALE